MSLPHVNKTPYGPAYFDSYIKTPYWRAYFVSNIKSTQNNPDEIKICGNV